MSREALAAVGRDTLAAVDQGWYQAPSGRQVPLRDTVAAAIAGTRVYTPRELGALVAGPGRPSSGGPRIEVTDEGTQVAGRRLVGEGEARVAVLNFASALSVGGGFLGGASAQEEELCRVSALYRCLETAESYYAANRACGTNLYTDHLIWSPAVPFFRDGARAFVEAPYPLGVITSPAPMTRAAREHEPDAVPRIPEVFARRAAMVLAAAEDQGQDTLVLGAWGCGAFGGDPEVAADAFGAALEGRFAGSFRRVVFAVLAPRERDRHNLEVFRRRFA
jgi:uncharacterized protein (TIGR02452 family)